MQVEKIQEIMKFLDWESQRDAWSKSGAEECAQRALDMVFLHFASERWGVELRSSKVYDGDRAGCVVAIKPDGYPFRKIVGPADEVDASEEPPQSVDIDWSEYELISMDYFEQFDIVSSRISAYCADPLVPEVILENLISLRSAMAETLHISRNEIQTIARDFPRHYPSKESLTNANLAWANNQFEDRGQHLFSAYKKLRKAIREYLKTDELFAV